MYFAYNRDKKIVSLKAMSNKKTVMQYEGFSDFNRISASMFCMNRKW